MNGEGYHWENTEEGSQKRRNWSGVGVGIEAGSRRGGRLQSCGMRPDVVGEAESKPASVAELVKGLFDHRDELLPGAPRHVCTKFRANIRKT